jgi:putative membrane protein insertion efficiency factor
VKATLLIAGLLTACAESAMGIDPGAELKFITSSNPISKTAQHIELSHPTLETSDAKLVGMGLISLYQRIVSSQQTKTAVCTFTPSCSHFGQSAVQQCGLFHGSLLTADRLLRCHPYNSGYYQTDPKSTKLYDPLKTYQFK